MIWRLVNLIDIHNIKYCYNMKYLKSFGLLILRICIGAMLIHHGYEKLENIPNFANAFVKPLGLPFPEFFSYVAAYSEIVGSWLLSTVYCWHYNICHLSCNSYIRFQYILIGVTSTLLWRCFWCIMYGWWRICHR